MINPYPPFRTTVAAAYRLSQGFVRITLAAPALRNYAAHGLDQRIKIILQLPGGGYGDFGILDDPAPTMPQWFARWRELPDEQRNIIRTFTASGIRPERGEIDVDFAIHQPAGPACRWALEARVGDELVIIGPDARAENSTGGIDFRPGDATSLLLAADETAFPALRNILDVLDPGIEVVAFAESSHAQDLATLAVSSPHHQLHLLERGAAAPGEPTLQAMRSWAHVNIPGDGNFYAWLAGESSLIKAGRRILVREHGVASDAVTFSGYWKHGQAEN